LPPNAEEEKEVLKANYEKMYNIPSADLDKAARLGYTDRFFKLLPERLMRSFYGSANPWNLGDPAPESTVVDFGSGLGVDCVLAAKLGAGRVIGIDLTPKAVADATQVVKDLGLNDRVSFMEGDLETADLAAKLDLVEKVDLISSNGVINLTDVKQKVFDNAFKFLKSGGMMRFSDMAMETPLPTTFG